MVERVNGHGLDAKQRRRMAKAEAAAKGDGKGPTKGGNGRSGPGTIRLSPGRLPAIVDAAGEALGRATGADPFGGVYRRGALLVRPVRLADERELKRNGVERSRGALVIATVGVDALRVILGRAARWERYDARRQAWAEADPPADVAKAVLAAVPDLDAVPVLVGIVEAPCLRPDGSVLEAPGYDAATGLLFDPGPTSFPSVPERPTKAEAEAALETLRAILAGFPFLDGPSEAVGVSLMVTPQVRKACRSAPLHAVTAPKMASGKTLLARLAGYVATGRSPSLMPQADDPAEERKRLLGVLLDGEQVSVFDNVEREMKSDALCTVLTETAFTDRMLGVNAKATAPCGGMFIATGNNLTVVGDLTSRTVSCALDPACERPEEREFTVNLDEHVPAHRGELAVAALTIVRAYRAHLDAGGERARVPNFARFEDWSRFVREPLVWLGMADPCAGRERVEGRDTVRTQLGALLEAWRERFPGGAATVAEAIKAASDQPPYWEEPAEVERRDLLRDALAAVGGDRVGRLSAGAIGKYLAKYERRIEGGLMLERAGKAHKVERWKVRPAGPEPEKGGMGGMGGLSPPTREQSITVDRAETNPPYPPYPPFPTSSPADGSSSWQDHGAWLDRLEPLRGHNEALRVEVLAWAKAAGWGTVPRPTRGGLTLIVPPRAPDCTAKSVLLRQARDAGLMAEELAGAAP